MKLIFYFSFFTFILGRFNKKNYLYSVIKTYIMKTVKLKTFAGNTFDNVAEEAKVQATNEGVIVEFYFNGILCKVSEKTGPPATVKVLIK